MNPTISWSAIGAAWGVLLAGSFGVMKTTDMVHSWTETHLPKINFPPYTWIVVACGTGIVTCLTSHLNPFLTLFPTLGHTYGEVLSGIALGGIASPGHHLTALIAAKSQPVVPFINAPDETVPASPDVPVA
jgi:hypothetical protein